MLGLMMNSPRRGKLVRVFATLLSIGLAVLAVNSL